MDLGALADDLGCFPLDNGTYLPLSDSRDKVNGLRRLVGFGSRVRPLALPAPYGH